MKLELDELSCTKCGECISNCPKQPPSMNILLCKHCAPETAPCRLSCPKGAIKEEDGILFISEECDGCGECFCPEGALVPVKGGMLKCDLCFGEPQCVAHCPEGALRLEGGRGLIGWKTVDRPAPYRVVLPELSFEEERLVNKVVEEFKEVSKNEKLKGREEILRRVQSLVKSYCVRKRLLMEKKQFNYLCSIALMNIHGYGVLDELLSDDELEEIAVIGVGKPAFVYHRRKGWLETNCIFTSEAFIIDAINKMARVLGRRITLQTPRINAVLPDGSRLHASRLHQGLDPA